MVQNDALLKKLRTIFDLNIYEAKIWTGLLQKGVASASELADISGVPRSRSYDVLETLEKKGYIMMKLGKPMKYMAIKPEDVIKRLKSRITERAEEHVKELDTVNTTSIFTDLELLHKQGIEKVEPTEMSGLLKGRKSIHDELKTLISEAKSNVTIVTTSQGLFRKFDALKSTLRRAKERGVSVRIAAPVDNANALPSDLKNIAEIRKYEGPKARFVLVDAKHVVFMTSDDKEVHESYDSAVWVNTPFFAKSFEQMFDSTWQKLERM
ncbi:MAG TPA: TrmB family transcriptional regulator [Nanoarchaeota archaeon]|nr:TrmB family transcriptional regulator [Nanoarchaeota archaeon]